jgi:hypothetical protein
LLKITENLYNGLTRLRPQPGSEPLLLWVDTICINQADVEERNAQVVIMANIYKKAPRVVDRDRLTSIQSSFGALNVKDPHT